MFCCFLCAESVGLEEVVYDLWLLHCPEDHWHLLHLLLFQRPNSSTHSITRSADSCVGADLYPHSYHSSQLCWDSKVSLVLVLALLSFVTAKRYLRIFHILIPEFLMCCRSIHLIILWFLFENVMALHRCKAIWIGFSEADRANEWIVTQKLGNLQKLKQIASLTGNYRFKDR